MTLPASWYQPLLEPVCEEAPCGISLEYDAGFILLQSKLQPKLSAEYGDFVEVAEPVNWGDIERECLTLLRQTRDIRLFIILMRCRLRQTGLTAIYQGLAALLALLTRFPDDLHPQLIDEGEFDPLMRANAFAELDAADGLLSDLRSQLLPAANGLQVSIKEYEKAHASPREEGALSPTTLEALQRYWEEQADPTILSLQLAAKELERITLLLSNTLAEDAPDLYRLRDLLQLFCAVNSVTTPEKSLIDSPLIHQETGDEVPVWHESTLMVSAQPTVQPPTPEQLPAIAMRGIETRTAALSQLREVRAWYEKNEPSSPVTLLLAFAERTAGQSFSTLIKMLSPEMISQLTLDED